MNSDVQEVMAQGLRGHRLLRAGSYAEGFQLHDDAWRKIAPNDWLDLPIPRWNGEPLEGKRVLVTGEQGFGDQIMFARFAKLLQDRGAQIAWATKTPLRRLLTAGMGFEAPEEPAHAIAADFYCPSGALPRLFFPGLIAPPAAPYISAPADVAVPPGKRIGVVTSGDPANSNDAARSIPDRIASEFLALPGLMSLKPEHTGARDFYDTARLIAGLDLVITVDTSIAHLAGAMGRPVWVLLSTPCDWRWMEARTDSPWYPSAHLFRQTRQGDWTTVLEPVAAILQRVAVALNLR